jgi:hypothetical protein
MSEILCFSILSTNFAFRQTLNKSHFWRKKQNLHFQFTQKPRHLPKPAIGLPKFGKKHLAISLRVLYTAKMPIASAVISFRFVRAVSLRGN